jgi:LacI family transcriptional regulator
LLQCRTGGYRATVLILKQLQAGKKRCHWPNGAENRYKSLVSQTPHGKPSPTSSPTQLPLKSRLAERVCEAVRTEIRRGRWRAHLPPERQLASEFQVSRPTLHLALSVLQREGLLRTEPRQPWQVVRRGAAGSAESKRRPEIILLRLSRIKRDLASDVLWTDPLRQKLHRIGLGLTLADPFTKGMQNFDKRLSAFDREHHPSFYILASVPPLVHRWFELQRVPALIFGSRATGVRLPTVDIDHNVTARHAVDYLLRRGHRRIGLLNLPPTGIGAVTLTETFVRHCGDWPRGKVEAMVETALERPPAIESAVRRMFACARPPTAVLTADMEMTIGLYTLLAQLGLRIPQSVSVFPLFYWPTLDFLWPTPTCYRFSWETVANRMTRIISNYLRLGVLPNSYVRMIPSLREGRSVATIVTG